MRVTACPSMKSSAPSSGSGVPVGDGDALGSGSAAGELVAAAVGPEPASPVGCGACVAASLVMVVGGSVGVATEVVGVGADGVGVSPSSSPSSGLEQATSAVRASKAMTDNEARRILLDLPRGAP